MKPDPIRIFVTGGTFDKEYNELSGTLFFQDSHVPEMLRLGRRLLDVQVRRLMMIDSLEMTEDDRRIIAGHCRNPAESRIVITHGTDTMVETAQHLGREVTGKTIVLTGAMIPYKFGSSDGMFNLGSAIVLHSPSAEERNAQAHDCILLAGSGLRRAGPAPTGAGAQNS